ncbi:MAG: arsenate reductase ArsC [Pseudobdellovibrionaceae bacterium]
MKILFMCVANSARSQLAEGLAKHIFGNGAWIESAGSEPKALNPYAVQALKEVGIDISKNYSKSVDRLSKDFLNNLDYIITLCAEEVCPLLPSGTAQRLHWPFPDPAGHPGSNEEQLERFKTSRDAIQLRLEKFKESV